VANATTADPTVTSALPSAAPQDTTLDVQINGSGFDRGSNALFELNGAVDARVHVNSTHYLKSTQLVANLTIAIDAVVSPYDVVVVTSTGKKGIGTDAFTVQLGAPTATIKLPLSDAGLSLKSDGQFGDGTFSLYKDGTCGITGMIFVNGSGDGVVDGSNPSAKDRKCIYYPRKVTVLYPDGIAELISGPLMIVHELESQTYLIPIGSTARRHFNVRTNTTRCDGVHWGFGGPVGGDSVLVNRTAADTWHVYTQPYPNDQAACRRSTAYTLLGHMPIDLWIVSSHALP
jgi:hypothetical protein